MARIAKSQKAGMDFLDLIVFSDLVVNYGMSHEELQQIDTVIDSVKRVVECKYSGIEAEANKHFAFFVLEVELSNSIKDFSEVCPSNPLPPNITINIENEIDRHSKTYQIGLTLGVLGLSTGIEFDCSLASQIFETNKDVFQKFSPLVRRNLMIRCFVREFYNASVLTYCWLIFKGVLPVTKNSTDRIFSEFSPELEVRLSLIADYVMIVHYLNLTVSKDDSEHVFLECPEFELDEKTIDNLVSVKNTYTKALYKGSLRNAIPLLTRKILSNEGSIIRFFEDWADRKARFRMHNGTLASWPGILGATIVQRMIHAEHGLAKKEKTRAIYNACDNSNTITESARLELESYGIRVGSDALYRSHSKMKKTLHRLIGTYSDVTRLVKFALAPIISDPAYGGVFIHAEKLSEKSH